MSLWSSFPPLSRTEAPLLSFSKEDENFDNEKRSNSILMEYSDDETDDLLKIKGFFRNSDHGNYHKSPLFREDKKFDEENPERQRYQTPQSPVYDKDDRGIAGSPDEQSPGRGWIKRWAYSFRSPVTSSKHPEEKKSHRRASSGITIEYPHYNSLNSNHDTNLTIIEQPVTTTGRFPPPPPIHHSQQNQAPKERSPAGERSPLLKREISTSVQDEQAKTQFSIEIAAAFLRDYETNRPPTFASSENISPRQLKVFHIRYSVFFNLVKFWATCGLFLSCFLEGFEPSKSHRILVTALNMFGIIVFSIDLVIRRELGGRNALLTSDSNELEERHRVRTSRSEQLVKPLILFCVVLAVENWSRLFVSYDHSIVLFSSIFKPIVLFYVSSQARDALAAVRRILKIVTRVIIMELLLILMFAAVACQKFQHYDKFRNLSSAWLSLFQLSTTVVNPSLWMPMYNDAKHTALFFIFFIVTAVFYLHSLVLSVVFQTYVQAAAEIHERNATDREDAVHLAFTALLQEKKIYQYPSTKQNRYENVVEVNLIRQTLQLVRPHYSAMKINALVEIVDPSDQGYVDYPTFRTKIRQALNASIRTARNASTMAMMIELIAVAVAVVNFIYVILVSSTFSAAWFQKIQVAAGFVITLFAALELLIRFNPLHIPDFTPMTRLNTTFDGAALLAALTSCVGMVLFMFGHTQALDFMLMGRSLDMIRTMRFFQIFRDIVRRSSDVAPALAGPLILVVTTLHIFNYLGMSLWGGAVEVGQHEGEIVELYDLNNFNSYQEGSVTMFQVMVVNDWHSIAEVFLYATRCATPYIVYPFFIAANLIGVSIMLNVMTAFFVETFVTKLNDDVDAPAEATATMHKDRDFNIQTAEGNGRRITTKNNPSPSKRSSSFRRGADVDTELISDSERFEFDVYEREGFDKIMQTVTGAQSHYDLDSARHVCQYLEIFESLSPKREAVGYLVCDQQSLERFGNRRFKTKAIGFLDETKLHGVVSDMHAELLSLGPRTDFENRSITRTFPHRRDSTKTLEISAALLRRHPALSVFVNRTITDTKNTSNIPLVPDIRRKKQAA